MATRLFLFLFSGSLLISWIAPPDGLSRYALIIAFIIVGAYVDAWTRGGRQSGEEEDRPNVVSLAGYRKHHRQTAFSAHGRERRSMAPVFASHVQSEADELAKLLRVEGLHPVLVTAQTTEKPHRTRYEIRLAHHESERGQALVKWFRLKAEKHPN